MKYVLKPIYLLLILAMLVGCTAQPASIPSSKVTSSPVEQTIIPTAIPVVTAQPTISPTATPAPTMPPIFTVKDLVINGVKPYVTRAEAEKVLGKAVKEESETWEASGITYTYLQYDGYKLMFEETEKKDKPNATLMGGNITKTGIAGPRNIQVGDSKEKVIAAYPVKDKFFDEEGEGTVLYCEKVIQVDKNYKIILPPRGVESTEPDEKGRTEITYLCPIEPYEKGTEEEFIFQIHAGCTYYIKDGKVDEIDWWILPLGE